VLVELSTVRVVNMLTIALFSHCRIVLGVFDLKLLESKRAVGFILEGGLRVWVGGSCGGGLLDYCSHC